MAGCALAPQNMLVYREVNIRPQPLAQVNFVVGKLGKCDRFFKAGNLPEIFNTDIFYDHHLANRSDHNL